MDVEQLLPVMSNPALTPGNEILRCLRHLELYTPVHTEVEPSSFTLLCSRCVAGHRLASTGTGLGQYTGRDKQSDDRISVCCVKAQNMGLQWSNISGGMFISLSLLTFPWLEPLEVCKAAQGRHQEDEPCLKVVMIHHICERYKRDLVAPISLSECMGWALMPEGTGCHCQICIVGPQSDEQVGLTGRRLSSDMIGQ